VTTSFPPGGRAIVIGASGGIGAALVGALQASGAFSEVVGLSRSSANSIDICDEASVKAAAARLSDGAPIRLVIVATGVLKDDKIAPEKSLREIDADALAHSFAVNTIGPALALREFLPLLPRDGKAVFAALSARVGSIGDNRLGGWYAYRASKAALNQLIRTASVELARSRPEALCVALHPGTVATPLSAPFIKSGLDLQTPDQAATRILGVIEGMSAAQSGGFFDHMGQEIIW
jgi:NAD(P)-dependent dehydrogenase (short-subunit alcohol dehydrogenase family)